MPGQQHFNISLLYRKEQTLTFSEVSKTFPKFETSAKSYETRSFDLRKKETAEIIEPKIFEF